MKAYEKEKYKVSEAKYEAQKIAFAPFVFQAALALRDLGILSAVEAAGEKGISLDHLAGELSVPRYGLKVLLEAGLGMRLVLLKDGKYSLAHTGYFVLHDPMTRVNMDFVQDVNYRGFFHLKDAVLSGKPEGLKEFGNWPTIYEALASLPPQVQKSWFQFDHFYSDAAFEPVLPLVFKHKPRRLLDVGGNTGRWALHCLRQDPDIEITIADLPGQLRMAERHIRQEGFADRVSYYEVDLLNDRSALPQGHDAVWMSQFLDCFSPAEITSILKRAAAVMMPDDHLFILETFWNRQKFEAASFCLQQTSLYFTCLANGTSQMYHSEDLEACLKESGLKVAEQKDQLGISHTLLTCVKKS